MSAAAHVAKKLVRSYRQTIDAPPGAVFPLLCPVREADWLEGWSCTMIHSASGLAEEGAVFTTSHPGEADTIWIVTRHDPGAGCVQFARVTPGSRTCVLEVSVSARDERSSHVLVTYAVTSLGTAGDEYLESWTEEAFLSAVGFWEDSMNHYLATGRRLAARGD